jgi:hypothetical protein
VRSFVIPNIWNLVWFLSLCLLLVNTSCTIDPFRIEQGVGDVNDGEVGNSSGGKTNGSDARLNDDSESADRDGRNSDSDTGMCAPSREICDGKDNDCDGLTDEDFDLQRDPSNCGACGQKCDRTGTIGNCVEGECQYTCEPGYIDLDDDLSNGCEYPCELTAGGVEECDDIDNDCDGETDEDFDLDTDINNCGRCQNECVAVNGEPSCDDGVCVYACDDGYADILSSVPGCEYACPQTPPSAEICDTIDNDCDGEVDEDVEGVGDACTPEDLEEYEEKGECSFGRIACVAGIMQCVEYVSPTEEVCNNLDDDCDGETDEGFDKLNSIQYCGDCSGCHLAHASAACVDGECEITACVTGYVNVDTEVNNGCEYECTPSGPEICDGIDNDCDRLTDSDDPDLVAPAENFCRTVGACDGTVPTCAATSCDSQTKWRCVYPADKAELENCELVLEENVCDDIDGDCDGQTDESFAPDKGLACADDGIGACRGTGSMQCNDQGDGLECVIDKPGHYSAQEQCNGIDDNCDGEIDNNAVEDLVKVDAVSLHFWIYTYEAAHPDATASEEGSLKSRSCSKQGVLPWRDASWDDASEACAAAGMRLCTVDEWQAACEGPLHYQYPYGEQYEPDFCNGKDYDLDCQSPDDDTLLPTGNHDGCPTAPAETRCVSDYGAVDMSGNLHEWTGTEVSSDAIAYRVRGGSYQTVEAGLSCSFDFIAFEPWVHLNTLGFRCCKN